MSDLPKKKRATKMLNLTIRVPEEIWDIYHEGSENNWDVSEIGRQALTDKFRQRAAELKKPAS